MMVPMFCPVPVLETQKESTQGIERIASVLAGTRVNPPNYPLRALRGKLSSILHEPWLTKCFPAPLRQDLRQDLNNHKMITILKNLKTMIPKRVQYLFLN